MIRKLLAKLRRRKPPEVIFTIWIEGGPREGYRYMWETFSSAKAAEDYAAFWTKADSSLRGGKLVIKQQAD